MDELRRIADLIAFGLEQSEELLMFAAEALVRGIDSPSLRDAAGVAKSEVRDARDRFLMALDELDIDVAADDASLWRLVRRQCEGIVARTIDPGTGAVWIWKHLSSRIEREGDLRVFVGLGSAREKDYEYRDEIDAEMIDAAQQLRDRPEPRQWVMLRAERDTWPLSKYKDNSRFALGDCRTGETASRFNLASDAVFDIAKPKIQAAIRRFREKDPNADLRGPDDLLPKR